MPAAPAKNAPPTLDVSDLRHEPFCLPRPGQQEPRVEGFVAYSDDAATGRSRPTADVVRCLECGAAKYNLRD